MRFTSYGLTVLIVLSILAPSAEAQRWRRNRRGLGTAAALGVISAIAASRAYSRPYYGGYGYGGYGYGYGAYPYRTYGYAVPSSYVQLPPPAPPGAVSFVDQGDFRNYRDAYGNYIGRVPLVSLY